MATQSSFPVGQSNLALINLLRGTYEANESTLELTTEQIVFQKVVKDSHTPATTDGNTEMTDALLYLWGCLTPEQQKAITPPGEPSTAAMPSDSPQPSSSEPEESPQDLFYTGALYYEGKEVSQDIPKALDFWKVASKKGNVECSLKLAEHYRNNTSQKDEMIEYYYEAFLQAFKNRQNEIMIQVYKNLLKLIQDSTITQTNFNDVITKLSIEGRSWKPDLGIIVDLTSAIHRFHSGEHEMFECHLHELPIYDDLKSEIPSYSYEQSDYSYSSHTHSSQHTLRF